MSNHIEQSKKNVVMGDVKVDLGGGATGSVGAPTVALEKVMAIAASIWKKVGRSGVKASDDAGNDALMKTLQIEFKEFATSYPIPFRWMVQAREYAPEPFEKYLKEHVKAMYKDRSEFMASQGEYLVLLYKHRHPRAGGQQLERYRAAITKSLQDDDDQFTASREEAERAVEALDRKVNAERRKRMVEYLHQLKALRAQDPDPQNPKDPHHVETLLARIRAARIEEASKPAEDQGPGEEAPVGAGAAS